MHLLTIAGFLGSGKTTFLLRVAAWARQRDLKVAVLVNEAGEIGIDNELMRRQGLDVRELLGGCICCSMAGDMAGALESVGREFSPDLILVEPTGAADPRNLQIALNAYKGPPFESRVQVVLVDPLRLEMLMNVVTPLITSTILQADLVLVSKADEASDEEKAYARRVIREIKPEAPFHFVSAEEGLKTETIRELMPWTNSN